MELLEQRILSDGRLLPGGILKVDNFLNHQMDPMLLQAMAKEWHRLFEADGVNKILTIEASGIAMAILVGLEFQCPVVFAKKSKTKNISDNLYQTEVPSFTHGNTNTVVVSKDYLKEGDRVLLIDDFLATGAAFVGLKDLVGWRRGRDRKEVSGRRRQAPGDGRAGRVPGADRTDGRQRDRVRIKTVQKPETIAPQGFADFSKKGNFVQICQNSLFDSGEFIQERQLTFDEKTAILLPS